MAAPILWGIFLLASKFVVSKIGSAAAKKLVKKGAKQVAGKSGQRTWKRESGAAKNAEGLQAAQSVGGAAKAIGEGTKVAAARSVGGAAKAIGEGTKVAAARLAKTPWLNKAGDFTKLDKSAIQNLTTSQAKLYREAAKAARGVDKAKRIQKLRSSAEATVNPVGRVARRVGIGAAHASKVGSRARGAARLALGGAGAWTTGTAIGEGISYLLNRDEKGGEEKDKKKKNGKDGNGGARGGSSTAKSKSPPANPSEEVEIAKDTHGKYSKQAGRALGKKHGIDISYDFPGMSADDYQKGLDKGTISKKLGKTKKGGKLTERAKEELEERRLMRHGGSVSADNYKLRKKSSKAKSAKVSKKSSWNY